MNSSSRVIIPVLVLVAAFGAWTWWRRHAPISQTPTNVARPIAPPVPTSPPPSPAAIQPTVRFPIAPEGSPRPGDLPAPDDADAYLKNVLGDLLGRKSVASFLVFDGLARRFVTTVNNLGTDNAAAELWPVKPTAGRIRTEGPDDARAISQDNADRYEPFVRLVAAIDTERAVGLYRRLYPLFQRAYEELGEPGKYFNDRVIGVIDNLIATPDVAQPIKVKRVSVDGSPRPPSGDGLYVFQDPQLEALSSGQKILLRVGRENATKLRTKLADIRQHIIGGAPSRPGR